MSPAVKAFEGQALGSAETRCAKQIARLPRRFDHAAGRALSLLHRASFGPVQNENGVMQPHDTPSGLTPQSQFSKRISAGSRAAAGSQGETDNSGAKLKETAKLVSA
ncbi:MAG: hypothetical protein CML59_03300 [Rhodobacteraceae bacterium]|nr:hypothetical protein [Paracoccaceae bacterium]